MVFDPPGASQIQALGKNGLPMRIAKLDPDTKFRIDFGWWEREKRNFRLYLHDLLCESCRQVYPEHAGTEEIDWIDPQTAEVKRVDALWQSIRACCSQKLLYITRSMPLTIGALRALVANDNTPLSARELHQRLGKSSPETILKILAGERIYYGIVPLSTPEEAAKGSPN